MAPDFQLSQQASSVRLNDREEPRARGTDWGSEEAPWYADLEIIPIGRSQRDSVSRVGLRDILAAWAFYAVLLAGLVVYATVSDFVAHEPGVSPRPEIKAQSGGQGQSRSFRADRSLIALVD